MTNNHPTNQSKWQPDEFFLHLSENLDKIGRIFRWLPAGKPLQWSQVSEKYWVSTHFWSEFRSKYSCNWSNLSSNLHLFWSIASFANIKKRKPKKLTSLPRISLDTKSFHCFYSGLAHYNRHELTWNKYRYLWTQKQMYFSSSVLDWPTKNVTVAKMMATIFLAHQK